MPKVKKIRAAALESKTVRHEPLGQAIQDDQNRNKYASNRTKHGRVRENEGEEEETLLDEKASERILKLSHEQRQEMDVEEEVKRFRSGTQAWQEMVVPADSDDEADEEETKPFGMEDLDEE